MQLWSQNGLFFRLRQSFSGRAGRKKTYCGVFAIIALICVIETVNRPNPARIAQEEYGVYSAYLFRIPLYAHPLPVVCREDPRYVRGGDGVAQIQEYVVTDQTMSVYSHPPVFSQLMRRKIEAPETPVIIFNNFLLRNLSVTTLANRFVGADSDRVRLLHDGSGESAAREPTVSARFTRVGFDRDFSYAMFYAEASCGGVSSREYVYLAKAYHRGYYWYVYRVESR